MPARCDAQDRLTDQGPVPLRFNACNEGPLCPRLPAAPARAVSPPVAQPVHMQGQLSSNLSEEKLYCPSLADPQPLDVSRRRCNHREATLSISAIGPIEIEECAAFTGR
jgi:hypothetical protein